MFAKTNSAAQTPGAVPITLPRRYVARMRDLDIIESELRLIAAVRRTAVQVGAPAPRIDLVDELLDERIGTVNDHPI
jgi:hypothetical protein